MPTEKGGRSPAVKQWFVCGCVCMNVLGHGCVMGYPATLLPALTNGHGGLSADNEQASWIASVMGVSMLLGNFMTPPIMERWGRRAAHLAVIMPAMAGWLLTIMATSVMMVIIGRCLHGLSVGMLMPLRSLLVAEYSSPRRRGAALATVTLSQAAGILLVHATGTVLPWRHTALLAMCFPFVSLIMTLYCPESPSWLATNAKYEQCTKAYRWLRGDEEQEELEMLAAAHMMEKMRSGRKRGGSVRRMIGRKEFYLPVVIMWHAYLMVQYAGGTTMATYSTSIIQLLLGEGADAHFWMIALDAQRLAVNAVACYFMEMCTRRGVLFGTGALCVASHLGISLYLMYKHTMPWADNWLPIVLLNAQFVSVAAGMIPLPGVLAGELFPLEGRAMASSMSVVSLAFWLFVVLKTFPSLVALVGLSGTYFLHAAVLSYCLLVLAYALPETRGRTLQQIEEHFRGTPSTPQPENEDLVMSYERKMSARRCSIPLL